jgi:adenine-specific DNA-methyltransferase
MPSKRVILEALTRTGLLGIARHYEITGLTAQSKANIVDALAGSRKVQPEEFLALFGRDDLKGLCGSLGLDESGREKQALIDRLMGREAETKATRPTTKDMRQAMAKKKTKPNVDGLSVEDYRHSGAKRKNNPPAKIAAEGVVPAMPKIEYSYSPRRPPVLRFDPTSKADQLPDLLQKATKGPLTKDEAQILAEALRTQQPWLEWAGKQEAESKGFTVDPVALHIHERISSQAILKVAARQDVERTLFSDPEQEYHEAVQFYKHDISWTNRMILGDSAQVMASLANREDLAGKVQMIFMDPPYGIKYGSNFQSEVGQRDVKEKESDLTRELEMVKAYRDIWHLGLHSYLCYLRDRLLIARTLLSPSGSIFVQIGDDNVHLVRCLLGEVFGPANFVGQIAYQTTPYATSATLPAVFDTLLWFARDKECIKYRQLYKSKESLDSIDRYSCLLSCDASEVRPLTKDEADTGKPSAGWTPFQLTSLISPGASTTPESFQFQGRTFHAPANAHWKTSVAGLQRAAKAQRIQSTANSVRFRSLISDFPISVTHNMWTDTSGGISSRSDAKMYVVQTSPKVVARCLLMTTDPGDLVLDPTCGSGTTALVAEQWGRRWITMDTSRVALSIARQRILTAKFEYYQTKEESTDAHSNPRAGFIYKTAPHITLKSVAQNPNLDPIFAKYDPFLDARLKATNEALGNVTQETRFKLDAKLMAKQRYEGKRAITDADNRRWQLPKKGEKFEHWTVPFDTDSDWPKELQKAVTEYRKAWRAKMDEVNACIASNAAQEELVDQPEVVRGIVRVSGPFTVEAVQPTERSLGAMDGMFDGSPGELEDTFDIKNVESYLDQMTRLLKLDGVRFPNNKEMAFSRLERLVGQSGGLHAEGRWLPKDETDNDPEGKANVAIGFGPQYGPVTAKQVEDLIRSASRRGYDALVIAGFSFDGPAQATIEDAQHPKLRIHMASIRPDINPGMAGLLKDQPGSQLFTVFGQPRTRLEGPNKQSEYVVHMEGVDIYDPVTNTIRSTEDSKVAAWFVDGDYDGRTFCITQAFFPDKSAWDKLAKALGGVVSEDAFEKLSGTVSLPFPAGKHKCLAVKVIDPRGNEVMQVHRIG